MGTTFDLERKFDKLTSEMPINLKKAEKSKKIFYNKTDHGINTQHIDVSVRVRVKK